MFNSAKSRTLVCIGLSLIVTFAGLASAHAALFGLLKGRGSKQAAAPKQSLLVFPFDQAGLTNVPEKYGSEVAASLRSLLAGNPKYSVFLYTERLAPIQRGYLESALKNADIAGPFSDDRIKALKLAKLCAADYYLVGSVDAFDYDAAAKVAQMTLSGELVDGRTGKSLGTYVVTGKADASSQASGEDEYRAVAAGRAVDALKAQVLPADKPKAEEAPPPAPAPATDAAAPAPAPEAAAPTNPPAAEPTK